MKESIKNMFKIAYIQGARDVVKNIGAAADYEELFEKWWAKDK